MNLKYESCQKERTTTKVITHKTVYEETAESKETAPNDQTRRYRKKAQRGIACKSDQEYDWAKELYK